MYVPPGWETSNCREPPWETVTESEPIWGGGERKWIILCVRCVW